MKRVALGATILAAMLATGCQQEKAETSTAEPAEKVETKMSLENQTEQQAYSLGLYAGRFIESNLAGYAEAGITLDKALIMKGFTDAMGDKAELTDEQIQTALQALDQQRNAWAEENAKKMGEKIASESKAFLEENAKKEGVKITESGLQYEVIEAGEGEHPAATDTVTVHYRGTLVDGKQFDSSYDRGEPTSFPLNRVISGWTEGLQLMKPGAKYRFYIPSELGYGERGAGQSIPPNAALIFDVELLKVGE